jgi:ABC-2 type transport system permease protein
MNLRRLWAVARKEAIHLRRDPRSLILAIGIPMLMIVLFGYALTLDVDRVPFVVWDQSHTPASRDYIARFTSSRYFALQRTVDSYDAIGQAIDKGEAGLALVIDAEFARDVRTGRAARVQAIIDGSDSNTAAIVLGYAQAVTSRYDQEIMLAEARRVGAREPRPPLEVRARVLFNADLESKNFIIPGLIAVIMGLIAALLTSLTIAREWERGTMEAILSTPAAIAEILLGKLLPYFGLGLVATLGCAAIALVLFDVPLRGSWLALLTLSCTFLIPALGQGLLISAVARNQFVAAQAALISGFLPAFLLSGFIFEIDSMPAPIRALTYIVAARYFVPSLQTVFLAGDVWGLFVPNMLAMLAIGAVFFTIAARKTHKSLDT